MKQKPAAPLAFILLTLLVSMGAPLVFSQTQSKHAIIFAVWPAEKGKKPDQPLIDPVVMLDGAQLHKPPVYSYADQKASDAVFDRFEKKYYASGRKYPLFLGGNETSTLTVVEPTDFTCVSNMAVVRFSVPLSKPEMALAATSTQGLGLHSDWRQPVTDDQRSAFQETANGFLGQKGVHGVLLPAIKIDELYSTKLGVDRPRSLIGSVTVKGKSAIRHLFLVATETEKEGQYVLPIASYNISKDLEDHTDNVVESFVGQLDLDNDGVDEIVTITSYYESWAYTIYKEKQGKWEKVYQGGGGGC